MSGLGVQRVGRSGGAGAQRVQEEWCSVRKMAELHSPARPVLVTCNNPARCSVWRRRMSSDINFFSTLLCQIDSNHWFLYLHLEDEGGEAAAPLQLGQESLGHGAIYPAQHTLHYTAYYRLHCRLQTPDYRLQ